MLQLCSISLGAMALSLALFSSAHGVTVYSESSSGDLSNNGLSPTLVTLAEGANDVIGTTGRDATTNVVDRDYFTVTVPSQLRLVALIEVGGTQAGGAQALGFIAIQSGNQVTLPTNTATAAGLLGWTHYGPSATDLDILPKIGVAANGSTGFVPPLGPGNYAFWVQDTTTGTFQYDFRLVLARVPEPSALILMLAGLIALWPMCGLRTRSR